VSFCLLVQTIPNMSTRLNSNSDEVEDIILRSFFLKYITSAICKYTVYNVRNRPATEPVMLKVHNVKLSFDI